MNFYTIIGQFAVWAVPVAPAAFFSIKIYDALHERLGFWVALPLAVVGAAGFETVGILNGHAMVSLWQDKRYGMATVAALLLSVYVVIGLYELGLSIGGLMILIGAVVYLTQGLLSAHGDKKRQQKEAESFRMKRAEQERLAKLQQQEDERRLEHELKLAKLAAQKEVKLSETAAKLSTPAPETFQKLSETFPTDWRKLTTEHKAQLAQMTEQEIAETVGVTTKTARAWLEKLT